MPFSKENTYTIDDIYKLPDNTRAELIDGQIYYMAPPSRTHQRISGELFFIIHQYIKTHNDSCEIYSAPFAVFLNEDDRNYIEPDISVICDSSKLTEKGCNGAPDFIIEVVSPGNPEHDYITKLSLYKAAGVREYWIVDPRNTTVTVYFFEKAIFAQHYTFDNSVKVNIYDNLELDFSELDI